jgi:hypothetical protein
MKFGKIKVFAHRFWNREPIPIFSNNKINREIDKHFDRIKNSITYKNKRNQNYKESE